MIDYSKEIKDLQGISSLAIDLAGRLTDKNAAVDSLKAFGHTELQTIAETATTLAVALAGCPDAMSMGTVGPKQANGAGGFDLAAEQDKLFGRENTLIGGT